MFALALIAFIVVLGVVGGILNLIPNPIFSGLLDRVASLLLTALAAVFFDLLFIIMYHDLRVVREGIDTDVIASVFD
jgi:hypothetical protein